MSNFSVDLEQQLNRIGKDFQHFVERIAPIVDETQDFVPDCDIVETDDSYKILLDLPGMSKENVHISLKESVLTVDGDRKTDKEESERFERRERKYGAFSRSYALPESVDASSIQAVFNNGILTITMAKTDDVQDGQSIPIS